MTTVVQMQARAMRGTLFVSTLASPSKAASRCISPVSTMMPVKQTETPRKLKTPVNEATCKDNNNAEDEGIVSLGSKRSGSWSTRKGFSPRPPRLNNPARRPVQSASSIRAMRLAGEPVDYDIGTKKKCDPMGGSNQSQLERIQEAEASDDETENDSDEEGEEEEEEAADEDQYDGDGEEDEDDVLQLYKSLSGDLVVRYDRHRFSHQCFEEEDDMVRM